MTLLQTYSDESGTITLQQLPKSSLHGPFLVRFDYPAKTDSKTLHLANSEHYFDTLEEAHKVADENIRKALNARNLRICIKLPEDAPLAGAAS